jgi:hypothetical protein
MSVDTCLPPLRQQLDRLVSLGVHELAGLTASELADAAKGLADEPAGLLVLHPAAVPASVLAPLLERADKRGFVVRDLTDLDAFLPVEQVVVPDGPLYVVEDPDRGDAYLNRTPDEALPEVLAAGRTPLTVSEGISWLLQRPDVLEQGRCFMTVGSRIHRPDGRLDARTPAVWISGGTGHDGPERRGAPKVGWCWAGNRHTWLGIASAAGRRGVSSPART